MEIPIRATIIRSGSKKVPLSTAASSPMLIDTTTQMRAAPTTSDRVAGTAAAISGMTFWPWFE